MKTNFFRHLNYGKKSVKEKETAITEFPEIPQPLRNSVIFFGASAFGIFVITIFIVFKAGFYFGLFVIGILLTLMLAAYAFYLYRKFSRNKFLAFVGDCTDTYKRGWRKQMNEVVFIDRNNHKTYAVDLYKNTRFHIVPGDVIAVYAPLDAFIDEKDGVNIISNYYGFEKLS